MRATKQKLSRNTLRRKQEQIDALRLALRRCKRRVAQYDKLRAELTRTKAELRCERRLVALLSQLVWLVSQQPAWLVRKLRRAMQARAPRSELRNDRAA